MQLIKLRSNEILIFHPPIFPFNFWRSIRAALAVLGRDVAALLVWRILVLQNVFDAELQALQAGLSTWSLGEGAGLRLLRTRCLGHPVPTRRQNVDSYPVHCKSAKIIKVEKSKLTEK